VRACKRECHEAGQTRVWELKKKNQREYIIKITCTPHRDANWIALLTGKKEKTRPLCLSVRLRWPD
jgi:hypothetical protein